MSKPCFQLKGGLFTLTVLHLQSNDLKDFEQSLNAKVSESAEFFQQLPIIVDLSQLPENTHHLDFAWLKNLLTNQGIIPVALHNIPKNLLAQAKRSGWAIFPNIQPRYDKAEQDKKAAQEKVEAAKVAEKTVEVATDPVKLISSHIRSGQQVYHHGDLVIINTVNTGAEVLADGNIHIYGPLRGRALAGVKGNTLARIFCQSLEAELVSIAGKYKVIEELTEDWRGKAVQIYLDKDELIIEPLTKEF
ncbi:septum site-determining protein MinC [Wohlfahrtiimonas chitiniclastica]|uniref:septum site-determining protein MinC n=1 Tax=Wohlfahrtiimonas chitiniclastica TaxID=400946 RepID=UPI0007B699C1|nr:septum site-determining protein MinC [Wohlfahrtiimonas chitiniclastica]KZX36358.1 septum site-determining protein MinC [Wohlfahrtiimonas chitiniclastica]OYQ75001.1 septum site-determining protein MinC [Wohlfahrtiimonas chitiniclastica]OYQ77395.1 septum site-determining protein MinC [Wohlfahrtiimonas chitiniclastica]